MSPRAARPRRIPTVEEEEDEDDEADEEDDAGGAADADEDEDDEARNRLEAVVTAALPFSLLSTADACSSSALLRCCCSCWCWMLLADCCEKTEWLEAPLASTALKPAAADAPPPLSPARAAFS